MRKFRNAAALALALVLAPGCVFAYKSGAPEDAWQQDSSLEARVAKLEKQMAACKEQCTMPCCAEQGGK